MAKKKETKKKDAPEATEASKETAAPEKPKTAVPEKPKTADQPAGLVGKLKKWIAKSEGDSTSNQAAIKVKRIMEANPENLAKAIDDFIRMHENDTLLGKAAAELRELLK